MSDQSATVSVSDTGNLQIGNPGVTESGHPQAISSQATKSIDVPDGLLNSNESSGVFFRLKYEVHGKSTSGVIPG